jgi:arginyl-tRNA synthetase
MRKCGYQVTEEYYINDYGRQINILALSVWLRYLQQFDFNCALPSKAYQGQYIKSIAHSVAQQYGQRFIKNQSDLQSVLDQTYQSMADIQDQEQQIDYLIQTCQNLLGSDYNVIHDFALHAILQGIQTDLEAFNVNMDVWFSENSLNENNQIHESINQLTQDGWIYRYENAQWFASSKLGDDKDRVIVRSNGNTTYFASDAAYLNNKFQRDYDHIIYLLGADHHGYVPRLKALAQAFNYENAKMYVPLVQFANLYKNGNLIQMSTRSGSFITLRELIEEVGTDATRFFYLMRKTDQHLDFDMDLAKSKTNENPVFYVQYAHARICSVFKQLSQHDVTYEQEKGLKHIHLLTSSHEQSLANHMAQYPDVIKNVSYKLSPHLLTTYLKELATYFHAYYNAQKFISNDEAVMQARLCLIKAVQYILKDGFYLLKINPVEQM